MKCISESEMIEAVKNRIAEAVGMTMSSAREHILQGAKRGIKVEPLGKTGLKTTLNAYWCDIHRGIESGHVKFMRKPVVFTVAAVV